MFSTIFCYELKYWFRQPSIYIYALLFFLIALATMWGMAVESSEAGPVLNAPASIQSMVAYFHQLILFLFPAIIGGSVYRDFRHDMYAVLYAYPLTKSSYLPAKFLSSLLITFLVVSSTGVGLFVGTLMPGVNESRLGPFLPGAYLQTFFLFILPTLSLFGAIVFAIVASSRNIYAGFISVVLLLLLQGLSGSLLRGAEETFLAAVLDPFGQRAVDHTIRYWTVAEQNERLLPLSRIILYNRLLWLAVAVLMFAVSYWNFSFDHYARQFSFRKRAGNKSPGRPPGEGVKVRFSRVRYDFSLRSHLRTTWRLAWIDFRYIITDWVFLCVLAAGLLFIFFQQAELRPQYGIRTLPVTWKMLKTPAFLFLGVIQLLTFLYAGMLAHRARIANMHQLVDVSPVPNGVFLFSQFLALVKMQTLLLLLILFGGVAVQAYHGYYRFEIGHYLFELWAIRLPGLVIWALASVFVQNVFTNPYLGLFLLILGALGMSGLPELGVEAYVFRYNAGPAFTYSDLDGYGDTLTPYFFYKFYWSLLGLFLLLGALCWRRRGLTDSFADRFRMARLRMRGGTGLAMASLLVAFLALGLWLYDEEKAQNRLPITQTEKDAWKAQNEKRYRRFQGLPQPRIESVKMKVDIYPEDRVFQADGRFLLVNRSGFPIDTLLVNYSLHERTEYLFDRPARMISRDTIHGLDIHTLPGRLEPNDTLQMFFTIRSYSHTLLDRHSLIKGNGTYFDNDFLPGLGYRPLELTDNGKRAQYGLATRDQTQPLPSDSSALFHSYSSRHTSWIDFEATIGTAGDQIAIAPGYLQKEWVENGRRYFHYKMDSPIKDYYGFNSGRFSVRRDWWRNIRLEIYHHPGHDRNIEHMMQGLKGALSYCTRYFGPYQHRQARIIEFPATLGRFATTFANSIPFSEIYFIMDTDTARDGSIDLPFYVSAHEMAHQWWGNQLLPADALGAKMLTESLAEYVALEALEAEYGQEAMRNFLKLDLDLYLRGRSEEKKEEMPLIHAFPEQEYIHYRKGAMVFHLLRDYLGAESLNAAIRTCLERFRFQGTPYATSIALLEDIRKVAPDSLQYLIRDLFETITLYDNKMVKAVVTELDNGRYQVDMEFFVRKYRSDGKGNPYYEEESGEVLSQLYEEGMPPLRSLPLADYIEVGIFGEQGQGQELTARPLYLSRRRITRIHNRQSVVVDRKPVAIGIDPYHKLIDVQSGDNLIFPEIIQ